MRRTYVLPSTMYSTRGPLVDKHCSTLRIALLGTDYIIKSRHRLNKWHIDNFYTEHFHQCKKFSEYLGV